MHFLLRAASEPGVLLNISAKFWRIPTSGRVTARAQVFFYGCSEARMAPPPPADFGVDGILKTAGGVGVPAAGAPDGLFSDDHRVMARVMPRIANNLNGACFPEKCPAYRLGVEISTETTTPPVRTDGFAGAFGPFLQEDQTRCS